MQSTLATNIRLLLRSASVCLGIAVSIRAASAQQVAWRVVAPGTGSIFAPAIGPDGTLYALNERELRAVSPEGNILWTVPAAPGPVDVAADGTIYTSASNSIQALNTDGTQRWVFDSGDLIVAGPAVGPNGNVYAVASAKFGGIGMFSLDAGGSLRWSNQGDPLMMSHGGLPHSIVFGENRAFVAMKPSRGKNPPALWAFDLDGNQAFTLLGSCQGQPVVSPLTGELITGNGLCQSVNAHDVQTGSLNWSTSPSSQSPCSGLADIAVGPDGAIYTAFCYRAFWSLTPSGTVRWFDDNFGQFFMMRRFGVLPDNSAVLELGNDPSQPSGRVRAYSPATGDLLWETPLPDIGASATTSPVFDWGRRRAYFLAQDFVTVTNYLYAIDLGCYADCDTSTGVGVLDVFDFLCFQDHFVNGEPYACDCDTSTGPGVCDVFDFLCYQDAFVAGCP
jgi:outer membrane protein assembly factor BamB